ncbi:MAG: NAD-dependent epimerase/dehydratase family protein [Thermoplasmata archaeon]|nr:MAG: NAD-dependent epimerase/dehydratase family protein [Thermoplasmata archaeon]
MNVLITGGFGFIGSKIADKVRNEGHEVTIFDINTRDGMVNGIWHIKGDIFDSKHVSEILKDCDCVIHMVGLPNARKAQKRPQLSYDLNVRSTQAILEAMRETEVGKFILPSSAAIYGRTEKSPVIEETPPNPANTYAYHKWIAEEICRCYALNYDIESTILRLFNVYGKEGTGIINILVERASNDEPVVLFGEDQLRDFIHIADIAGAFSKVIECQKCANQTINIGTGVGRSIKDIVELVRERFPSMRLERKEFAGELYDSVADISRLKSLIGFKPDDSLDVMKRTISEMI